jgi:hypothetical protein
MTAAPPTLKAIERLVDDRIALAIGVLRTELAAAAAKQAADHYMEEYDASKRKGRDPRWNENRPYGRGR